MEHHVKTSTRLKDTHARSWRTSTGELLAWIEAPAWQPEASLLDLVDEEILAIGRTTTYDEREADHRQSMLTVLAVHLAAARRPVLVVQMNSERHSPGATRGADRTRYLQLRLDGHISPIKKVQEVVE